MSHMEIFIQIYFCLLRLVPPIDPSLLLFYSAIRPLCSLDICNFMYLHKNLRIIISTCIDYSANNITSFLFVAENRSIVYIH